MSLATVVSLGGSENIPVGSPCTGCRWRSGKGQVWQWHVLIIVVVLSLSHWAISESDRFICLWLFDKGRYVLPSVDMILLAWVLVFKKKKRKKKHEVKLKICFSQQIDSQMKSCFGAGNGSGKMKLFFLGAVGNQARWPLALLQTLPLES